MIESLLAWGIVLIAVGLLLGVLELFIPSHGLLAVCAFTSAIAGVVVLFMHDDLWGITGLLTVAVLTPICIYWGFRLFEYTPTGKALLGKDSEKYDQARMDAEQAFSDQRRALVGMEGVATSSMFPVGEIRIGDHNFEAIADGTTIERGTRVRVIRANGLEIIVRPVA